MDKDFDKDGVPQHVERLDTPSSALESEDLEATYGVNEKKVIRKTDYRIVPWLALLYLLSFLDRSNIGNANLFGLSKQLKLSDAEYSACLAVFFAFYVLFEVPSNMVMKRWRPSMWLPIIMLGWGAVMVGMGFVQNFTGLFVARLFLGITEAGLFPGVSYYLTLWYRRYEINFRIALFFSAATLAGAFGGLLARLINLMDGVSGYQGWRWIFILEGIVTVLVAAVSFWMLHDYPDTAKFLTPQEKQFMHDRLKLDSDGCSQEFKYKFAWDAFRDWKVWAFSIMFQGALCPLYCFSLFSPTLTANLGYAAARAQLMSVPPYVLAALTTLLAGYYSDKTKIRAPYVIGFSLCGALGFLLLVSNDIPGVNYTGLFLAAAGVYPLIPLIVSWGSNCMGGSLKKGVGTAIIVSIGNAGGIISSFLYPSMDKPRYYKGHTVCAGYCLLCAGIAAVMWVYLKSANKKKEQRLQQRGRPWTPEEKMQYQDEGDNVDWFKYSL